MRIFLISTANGNCAKYSIIPLKSKTFKVSFMFIHLIFNNNFPDTAVRGKPSKSIRKCFVWFYKEQKLRNALQVLLDFQMNCSCMKPSNYYYFIYSNDEKRLSEAALQRRYLENVFWKHAGNLQGNTYVEAWFQWSCKATSLKSHFVMSVLLKICCMLSEHLFLRTALQDCFCTFLKGLIKILSTIL